jgi:tyrosyl-tRNA synthetase
MEKGLTFLEFNYMIMQSYDFYHLNKHYGCQVQFGGDDQWSNMLGGTELIRKKTGKDAFVLTIPLLTNSDGVKMGKTVGGAVWLDPQKTSPFEFYQYWRNVEDSMVIKSMKMLTFLPLEKIEEIENWDASRINESKEVLAYELTKLVHGQLEANKAQESARALFSGEGDDTHMPTTELEDFTIEGKTLLEIMILAGLASSKGEGRRLIEQGGISVDGEKVSDVNLLIKKEDLIKGIKIKKGKKIFHRVILK